VTVFSVTTRFLSFLFKVYISRVLGAETVGLYQICISVLILLLSLTAGGLPTVLSRKIAEAEVKGDYRRQGSLMSASLLIGLTLSVVVITIFYALGDKLSLIFADDRCVDMFLIMLPAVLTSTLYAIIRAWFWGRKKFLAFSFTEFLDNIFKIGFCAMFVGGLIAGFSGSIGIAIAFTAADTLCVIVLFILFFTSGGRLNKSAGFLQLGKSSAPITTMHITGSFVSSLTAIVIPAQLVAIGLTSAEATAAFGRVAGMAMPLLMAPTSITGALAVVLIPEMASYAAMGDTKSLVSKLESSIIFCMFISSLFFVLYAPLGKGLGLLFFGDETAGLYTAQCCLLMFPLGINQVVAPVVNSLGMENKCFFNYLAGLVVLLPCIFFLPKIIGVYSMAVGSGLCFSVSAVLNMRTLRKRLDKPIRVFKKSGLLVLCALPTTAITYFLQGILSHYLSNVFVIIFAGGIGAIAYFILVTVFKAVQFGSIFAHKFKFFSKSRSLVIQKKSA